MPGSAGSRCAGPRRAAVHRARGTRMPRARCPRPGCIRAEDNERGASGYHGLGGPLHVADLRTGNPLTRAFVDAAAEAGLATNDDFNGPRQEGAGCYQVTQRRGRRCSAATAYLRPAMRRRNLTVRTGVNVAAVLFEGRRAV